jgi:FAS-associated factor 2
VVILSVDKISVLLLLLFLFSADVVDPVGDVTRFIETYNESYGGTHPVFYQGTYSQVNDVC